MELSTDFRGDWSENGVDWSECGVEGSDRRIDGSKRRFDRLRRSCGDARESGRFHLSADDP
ncbi:MAG TPA: hypothetical protein VFK44_07435 [Bacillales bacterium]|nr:hypothetical protein [Bacillales bacterium]